MTPGRAEAWLQRFGRWGRVASEMAASRLNRLYARRTKPSPVVEPSLLSVDVSKLRVGAVLDKFSDACFRPECELISPNPDDFEEVFGRRRPDILLVESAWSGNGGAWRQRVESRPWDLGNRLEPLVRWCHAHGIPTAFWNKDDPVHFERFVRSAGLFSCVFTTDAGCISVYHERLGHQRVFSLPFAAQPAIHNPIADEARELPVCFAGSYWADRYEQRRKDVDILLKPALEFGLHIFDRNHGLRGIRALKWRFPEIYRPAIRGRLEYDQMVRAYKRYRVFLNVNAVPDSPTMFSRRVFELLACGTPVVSSFTRGIVELLGEDAVLFSSSEEETRRHLQRLLEDDAYWARRSLVGVRRVLSTHTYGERLRELARRIGFDPSEKKSARFVVMAGVADAKELKDIVRSLERQTRPPDSLILLRDADPEGDRDAWLRSVLDGVRVITLPLAVSKDPERLLDRLRPVADWVCVFRPGHHYGPHYLEDYALAARYGDAEVLGKRTYSSLTQRGGLVLQGEGNEYRFVSRVPSATVAIRTSTLTRQRLLRLLGSDAFEFSSGSCLSLDRFNYACGPASANGREDWFQSVLGAVDV